MHFDPKEGLLSNEYPYKFNFEMSKELYVKMRDHSMEIIKLIKRVSIVGLFCFKLLTKIKKRMASKIDLSREGYHMVLRGSQKNFPPKLPRNYLTIDINNIKCVYFRTQDDVSVKIFGAPYLPCVSQYDELIVKLYRHYHIEKIIS